MAHLTLIAGRSGSARAWAARTWAAGAVLAAAGGTAWAAPGLPNAADTLDAAIARELEAARQAAPRPLPQSGPAPRPLAGSLAAEARPIHQVAGQQPAGRPEVLRNLETPGRQDGGFVPPMPSAGSQSPVMPASAESWVPPAPSPPPASSSSSAAKPGPMEKTKTFFSSVFRRPGSGGGSSRSSSPRSSGGGLFVGLFKKDPPLSTTPPVPPPLPPYAQMRLPAAAPASIAADEADSRTSPAVPPPLPSGSTGRVAANTASLPAVNPRPVDSSPFLPPTTPARSAPPAVAADDPFADNPFADVQPSGRPVADAFADVTGDQFAEIRGAASPDEAADDRLFAQPERVAEAAPFAEPLPIETGQTWSGAPRALDPEALRAVRPAEPTPAQKQAELQRKLAERSGLGGFGGLCPVALRDQRELVDARPEFLAVHEGRTYELSSAEAKARFQANPAKYAPVNGGNDVVLTRRGAAETEGCLAYAVWFKDRLYMFRTAETLREFNTNPAHYAVAE